MKKILTICQYIFLLLIIIYLVRMNYQDFLFIDSNVLLIILILISLIGLLIGNIINNIIKLKNFFSKK